MSNEQKDRALLQQLIFGFFPSAVVFVAARLRIADLLAEGPKTSAEVATATGTHGPSLTRLLRALVYLGVLQQSEHDRFGLTGVGAMLRSDAPDSVWATVLLFCGEGAWRSWGELLSSVTTGEPVFPRIFGKEPMAPERDATEFNRAMSEGTRQVAPGVIGAYDFSTFTTLVDVGGGLQLTRIIPVPSHGSAV